MAASCHACHKIATALNNAKRPRQNLSSSHSFFPLFFSSLSLSYMEDIRRFSSWNRVLRTRAASTWFQVACRGYRARTSPSPGGTCTFRVHPPLLPSTFFPTPHTPSPIPFRHNNRAVSQRVFNGRRLHATRGLGPVLLVLFLTASLLPPRFLSLSLVLSSFSLFLHVPLSLAHFSEHESFFFFFLHLSSVLISASFSSSLLPRCLAVLHSRRDSR